jgi:hypothetical protein
MVNSHFCSTEHGCTNTLDWNSNPNKFLSAVVLSLSLYADNHHSTARRRNARGGRTIFPTSGGMHNVRIYFRYLLMGNLRRLPRLTSSSNRTACIASSFEMPPVDVLGRGNQRIAALPFSII